MSVIVLPQQLEEISKLVKGEHDSVSISQLPKGRIQVVLYIKHGGYEVYNVSYEGKATK